MFCVHNFLNSSHEDDAETSGAIFEIFFIFLKCTITLEKIRPDFLDLLLFFEANEK